MLKNNTRLAALLVGTALATAAPVEAASAQNITDVARYCSACWRNAGIHRDEWSDCTQEVLVRLLEKIKLQDWPKVFADDASEQREFRRAIDAVRKRVVRRRRTGMLDENLPDDRSERIASLAAQRAIVNDVAHQHLSSRQQSIISMCLDGWSVSEVATELGMTPARVSDEKYKAVRKLQSLVA